MCDSNVPSKSSGSTPCSRCASSLHCIAPEPTSHSQLPTPARVSLSRSRAFDLGERRLRQPLLGDVADDDDCDQRRVALGLHGAGGQRDRHRHAVLAHGAGLESTDVLAGQHRGDDRRESLALMVGDQRHEEAADDLVGRVAEQPLGGAAPGRHRPVVADHDHRVIGQLDHGIEHARWKYCRRVFSIAGVEHQPLPSSARP